MWDSQLYHSNQYLSNNQKDNVLFLSSINVLHVFLCFVWSINAQVNFIDQIKVTEFLLRDNKSLTGIVVNRKGHFEMDGHLKKTYGFIP